MFYNEFIKYGLDKDNRLNLDEVVVKIMKDLKIPSQTEFKLLFKSVKRLSNELYLIESFSPFRLI